MDFFRVPPRPERPLNAPKMPDWIHKPSSEIGVLVPHAAVIGRSNQALVALAGFHVYSQGVEILMMLRTLSALAVVWRPSRFWCAWSSGACYCGWSFRAHSLAGL